jgi:hypothetical protein
MRGVLQKIMCVFRWVGADAEVAIIAIFAALLLILGPPLAAFYFLRGHHYVPAILTSGVWILAPIACVRDFRREHFGWATGILCSVWFVATAALLIICWR